MLVLGINSYHDYHIEGGTLGHLGPLFGTLTNIGIQGNLDTFGIIVVKVPFDSMTFTLPAKL